MSDAGVTTQDHSVCAQGGAETMLRSWLYWLLAWVQKESIPVQAGALQRAMNTVGQPYIGALSLLGEAIYELLDAVEVPVLVLLGKCGCEDST
jgi:hypothetical protein